MANSVFYSNTAQQTTLSGSISAGATSVTVGATTGFPSSFPYTLALDYGAATEELVSVTNAAGTTLTVTRGYGSTSAQSHSLGAVVRHTYDATDATAFRTHEAATAGVHGVAGTLVGTSDSQTLANKTLTSPTVNSGALSGTFSGSPTLSGNVTFSGTLTGAGALAGTWSGSPTFSGSPAFSGSPSFTGTLALSGASALIQGTKTTTAQQALAVLVSGDTNDRYRLYADGKQEWGAGNIARDVNLYRSAADVLKTDDTFAIGAAGTLLLGSAGDVNLYRSGSNAMATDDSLAVGGTLTDGGTGIRYRATVTGTQTITFASATSNTTAVSFGATFSAAPNIAITINSGAGSTIGFMCRALNVTTTGFDLNVATNGSAAAWSSIPVMWTATAV